jgi:transcriptional regulator with XRE-family HTH domain
MPDSRVAALLRSHGVPTRLSMRKAAKRCGVSPETISKLMRGDTRRIRKSNLDKIADGLGIPRDLLERESMVDAGYIQAASGSTVAEVLAQIQGLSSHDLATIQIAIGRMQQARAAAAEEMRGAAAPAE